MRAFRFAALAAAVLALAPAARAETQFEQNNRILLDQLAEVHNLTPKQKADVEAIFRRSGYIGQGNPAIVRHPMSVEECQARAPQGGKGYANRQFEKICGGKYMAPLYDPRTEKPEDAKACIDQFEFPDIPCTYPVTWVKAVEAAEICSAMGKRLCDAHEWEGACAGALEPPDYPFGAGSVAAMRNIHNSKYAATKSWAYGPEYQRGVCAADSTKSPGCNGGGWNGCGTNTYPTGAFPGCVSKLGVYDQHGNAAEHMNLPMKPSEMASNGSKTLGVTEMKGSWFIWDKYRAHPDWCRWRAPYWHGSRVMSPGSHSNYHLGFRCCKTVD
ncbi:SUMF1/EgtB/PvdO family nonheme iron enzyme [Actibacterium sp. MT2.3-13A]|uniref:SUMF1/EgtB/PvdO family nonheme iron enzyme n=1 Tax=Actibacterium sp. MT2.3-13A TaxID=2828332 RepID=UPI001BA7840E|nr:SUMF1/EgtB/PvdO family nonheme iron enzyme [Actibacterium sp. MT2.3-13A]